MKIKIAHQGKEKKGINEQTLFYEGNGADMGREGGGGGEGERCGGRGLIYINAQRKRF